MPHDRAPVATMLPPAVARSPLFIRSELQEAGLNITDLADEMNDDGSNARYVSRRIIAEIEWLFELLDELAEQVRQ